jgi:SAM-dependent methyltransferase
VSKREGGYQFGQDEQMHRILDMRSAQRDAAFLLPHLEPGQSLLDCGCGPGQITVGLAQAVSPGPVTGLDLDPAVLEQAGHRAADAGLDNVEFTDGSVLALPFPDESFDVVYAHALLIHLPEPEQALAEFRRVLKPGGIVAISEPIIESFEVATDDPACLRIVEFLAAGCRAAGGDPNLGKRVRPLLHRAGFAPTAGSMCVHAFGDTERARDKAGAWAGLVSGSALSANAIEQGLFSAAELAETAAALRAYGERPDAVLAEIWGEALGWK